LVAGGLPIETLTVAVRRTLVCAQRFFCNWIEMIHLTRLNNTPLVVNADLIKFIENAPDTVITLITGEKLVVRESAAEVLERIHEFHSQSAHRIVFGLTKDASTGKPDNNPASLPVKPPESERS